MIPRKSHLYIARAVLENATALSLVTGHPEHGFDSVLVRDANNLPTIPGTALAGVLRHHFETLHDNKMAEDVFGFQRGDRGCASRLHVGWASILDQNGRAVFGLRLSDDSESLGGDDAIGPLLEDDRQRQRVRLNHRGVAADTGKFDRAVLPAGCRFAVELALESDQADDPAWTDLLGLLASPDLRLGGGTRAGMGRMRLQSCHQRCFDLRSQADAEAFRALPPQPDAVDGLQAFDPQPTALPGHVDGWLRLQCEDFFRFGGEAAELPDEFADGKPADLLPKFEPVLEWPDGAKAQWQRRALLVPGASVKGALAHRTAFHYNALTGVFADDMDTEALAAWDKTEHCPGVRALFGFVAAQKPAEGQGAARAGCLYIDDARIVIGAGEFKRLMHVAIDQFTGGARHGMLFEEQMVATGREIELEIRLDQERLDDACRLEGIEPATVRKALSRALDDIATGMLPLGAASGRGHGVFTGRLEGELATILTDTDTEVRT